MSPYKHSLESVKRWGGIWQDYMPIHEFLDSTKLHEDNWSHRAILHNTFGVGVCEKIFGTFITNTDGKEIEVRYIAIQHIIEDCGKVPTIREWLDKLPPKRFALNFKNNVNDNTSSKRSTD